MTTKQYWKTHDIFIAAFLSMRGQIINEITRERKRCIFHFEDTDQRRQLVKEYYNNAQVGVTEYKAAIQKMRQAIRDMGPLPYKAWSSYEDVK